MPKTRSKGKVKSTETITNSFRPKKRSYNSKKIKNSLNVAQIAHLVENEDIQGQKDEAIMEEFNLSNWSIDDAVQFLRNFDLQKEFGPCLGIKRSERYERARDYGLNPPETVILIIRHFQDSHPDIENNVWTKHDRALH